jgi:hypothetical protein
MADTSKRFQVYLPTGARVADTFALLRDGDIIDLVDNELGPLQVEYFRDMNDNLPHEYARYRNGETSELVIQVTEEAAAGIDRLRIHDCPLPVQRRLCSAGGHWQEVEHYGLVQYGQRGSSSLTANGTDARDDLPAVRFPGTYPSGERYKWDKTEPIQWDKGSGASNAAAGIIYCDDPDCANCGDGCTRLYALSTNGTSNFIFSSSGDGGKTWATIATGLSAATGQALYCYYGRVFIAFAIGDVFYSDTPLVSGSWVEADLSDIPTGIPAPNLVRFAHPRKSTNKVLYALEYASGNNNGIARSEDNGATWQEVKARTVGPVLYDIAAVGRWVVAVGISGTDGYVSYSDDLGETFTSFTYNIGGDTTGLAVGMDLPNPLKSGDPVIYILSKSATGSRHALHKVSGANLPTYADWTLKWAASPATVAPGNPHFNVYTTAAGYLLWVHMPSISPDIAYVLKSIDGGATFVDMQQVILMDDTYGDRFAVCSQDGNRAILMGGDRP